MTVYTICPLCFQLSNEKGDCKFSFSHGRIDSDLLDTRATGAMAKRGYLLHDGALWHIDNDDEDRGLETSRIIEWTDTPTTLYQTILAHGYPVAETVTCTACGEADTTWGEICHSCYLEDQEWEQAEQAIEIRELL